MAFPDKGAFYESILWGTERLVTLLFCPGELKRIMGYWSWDSSMLSWPRISSKDNKSLSEFKISISFRISHELKVTIKKAKCPLSQTNHGLNLSYSHCSCIFLSNTSLEWDSDRLSDSNANNLIINIYLFCHKLHFSLYFQN